MESTPACLSSCLFCVFVDFLLFLDSFSFFEQFDTVCISELVALFAAQWGTKVCVIPVMMQLSSCLPYLGWHFAAINFCRSNFCLLAHLELLIVLSLANLANDNNLPFWFNFFMINLRFLYLHYMPLNASALLSQESWLPASLFIRFSPLFQSPVP